MIYKKACLAVMLAFCLSTAVADDCGQPEPVVIAKVTPVKPVIKPKHYVAKKKVVRKPGPHKVIKKKPVIKPVLSILPVVPKTSCTIKPPPLLILPQLPEIAPPIVDIKPELPPVVEPFIERPFIFPNPEPIVLTSSVPEPSSIALLALGLVAVGYFSKRK